MNRGVKKQGRRGAMAVFAAISLVILMAMVAFAADIGFLLVAKTDLQRAADAAAHAAVLEYRSDDSIFLRMHRARTTASRYVRDNPIINSTATVSKNFHNTDPEGDIVLGRIDFSHPSDPMTLDDFDDYNAVRVRIRRTTSRNGPIMLFFARALGHESVELNAEATAAVMCNVSGFKVPASGENVPFLPITLNEDFWDGRLNDGDDLWSYDAINQTIREDRDGIPEVVLYPNRTESGGNFGTVNIGNTSNAASRLGKQIRGGLTESDLDYHGGELALDESGELRLDGDPGLSISITADLEAITGKAVILPLYREVTKHGNNAVFTIVRFVGARVMTVNLTSGKKLITVQAANLTFKGTVQTPAGLGATSNTIYSPPVIVQ